jgi:hypothetical protein
MSAKISCQNCNMKNSLHLERCQYCGQTLEQPQHGSDADFQNLISNTDNSKAPSAHREFTMVDLVNAQNKTTAAIRSLALFFYINLCSSLAAAIILGSAYLSLKGQTKCFNFFGQPSCTTTPPDYSGYIIFSALVLLIGFIISLSKGIQELSKSA